LPLAAKVPFWKADKQKQSEKQKGFFFAQDLDVESGILTNDYRASTDGLVLE